MKLLGWWKVCHLFTVSGCSRLTLKFPCLLLKLASESRRPDLEEASIVDEGPVEPCPSLELQAHLASSGSGEGVFVVHVLTCPLGYKILRTHVENRKQLLVQTALETMAAFCQCVRISPPES